MIQAAARDDFSALLDPLIEVAQTLIRKNGTLYPFGRVMTTDGRIVGVEADTESEGGRNMEVFDLLVMGMHADAVAGNIRAVAICFDSVLTLDRDHEKRPAVGVWLEHREAEPTKVFMPYSKGRFRGWRFDDLVALAGERRVFEAD